MVEIGGRPILWHIMKMYASFNFKHFVLCMGYRGGMIKDYFLHYGARNNDFTIALGSRYRGTEVEVHGDNAESDWVVTALDTGQSTNTGARILRAAAHLRDDSFMVAYGDGVGDVNVSRLMEFHNMHGKIGTVTVVRPHLRFGMMDLRQDDSVARFREKPQSEDWVSAGFFVFKREFLDFLDDQSVLETEPLEQLCAKDELMAYRHEGYWQPMDTFREVEVLNSLWNSGNAPWATWTH